MLFSEFGACPQSHCFLGALIGGGREGAVWSEPRAGNMLGQPQSPFGFVAWRQFFPGVLPPPSSAARYAACCSGTAFFWVFLILAIIKYCESGIDF